MRWWAHVGSCQCVTPEWPWPGHGEGETRMAASVPLPSCLVTAVGFLISLCFTIFILKMALLTEPAPQACGEGDGRSVCVPSWSLAQGVRGGALPAVLSPTAPLLTRGVGRSGRGVYSVCRALEHTLGWKCWGGGWVTWGAPCSQVEPCPCLPGPALVHPECAQAGQRPALLQTLQ